MNLSLENKIAVVTGGARGIGEAMVRQLAKEGCMVYFTYNSSNERALQLENELLSESYRVQALQCDVKDGNNIKHICNEIGKENGRIDILINNAGINKDGLVMRMSEENWDEVMDTNLKSTFLFAKFVLPFMLKNGGSIVNISSIVGEMGNTGQANYAASKAGIIGFSKSIAKEYAAKNVRCNVVAPGFITSDMTDKMPEPQKEFYTSAIPLKRFGTTDEVANIVLFLASDASSYINGQVINVCGGLHT